MKSVWMLEWLIAARVALLAETAPARSGRAWRIAVAERDVGRGVLVEERVVEDEPGLADARGPVDERDLAEPRRAVVGRDVRPDQLLALVGVDLDGAAALEADPEAADRSLPWSCERVGRARPSRRRAARRGW